jgi:transposase
VAKPKSHPQLSLVSAEVYDDAEGIAPDHWSRLFYRYLFCALDDGEYAGLYNEGGRYPISPRLLVCITILQYMFRVSDRAAVENTIMRRDWRIALGITPEYTGFAPTVLCRFRQRLVAGDREREIFGRVLGLVRTLGLLRGRRRLRVDATHLVADVARLSRADAIQEAIRIVVSDAYERYPELRAEFEFVRLHEQYGEESWLGWGSGSDGRLITLGRDGYALLALCGERKVKGKETLAQILEQNFILTDDDDPRPRDEDDPRCTDGIVTPHEPDVRWGKKAGKHWLGDKVHVVETAEQDATNFVTDLRVTEPGREDSTVLKDIAERARSGPAEADTLIADGGYASAQNSVDAARIGLDLVAPPRQDTSRAGIPASEFAIDFERQVARCPEGHESATWSESKRGIQIRFRASTCNACARWGECTESRKGRSLRVHEHYEQLLRDRERGATPEFRELYGRRAAIEATISELVRCCGLRRSRYRGAPFRRLHAYLAAAALNVRRLLRAVAAGEVDDRDHPGGLWAVAGPPAGSFSLSRVLSAVVVLRLPHLIQAVLGPHSAITRRALPITNPAT